MDKQHSNIEIDITLLFRKLWARKFTILMFSLLFATITFAVNTLLLKPNYSSTTSIYVVNQHNSSESITTQDLQAGDYLVRDYKEIIISKDVLATVIEQQQLAMTTDDLLEKISVSIPTNTRIIYISAKDEIPEKAAELANVLREIAAEKIKQVTKVEEVNVVEVAEVNYKPSSPKVRRNTILGGVLGAFLATLFMLLSEVLDDRVKRPEDVEEVLGMTLLGIVPETSQMK